MIKRNIYKLHRGLSIIIAIPVIMWTLSGIMHPIMTSFKPNIKNQFVKENAIDTSKIKISPKDALIKNNITSVLNFRIVEINKHFYYQVKINGKQELLYLSTSDGVILPNGDKHYANVFAKKILGDEAAQILTTELITDFNEEYVSINRLLPAYKVNFDREDGIRLYVDTYGERMALAMDNRRSFFNSFFVNFHSLKFLSCFGNFQTFALVLLSSLAFLTSCMGIYIWFVIARKNKNTNEKTKYRRWHRKVAIATSITTLLFTFSGAFHAFEKFTPDNRLNYFCTSDINVNLLTPDWNKITSAVSQEYPVINISIVKMNSKYYWQVYQKGSEGSSQKTYLDTEDYSILQKGDSQYASFLANTFSGNQNSEISGTEEIVKFGGEYGFVNKRLPVMKIQYNKNDNERYYVETLTGNLSVKVQDKDMLEGYSFAMFHKYHFMDFLGKSGRDILTVIAAVANLLVTILGIILLVRFIRNKKTKK